jgi:hypothetical protein
MDQHTVLQIFVELLSNQNKVLLSDILADKHISSSEVGGRGSQVYSNMCAHMQEKLLIERLQHIGARLKQLSVLEHEMGAQIQTYFYDRRANTAAHVLHSHYTPYLLMFVCICVRLTSMRHNY